MQKGIETISVFRGFLVPLMGPLLWAAHFALIYSTQSTYCALRLDGRSDIPFGYVTGAIALLTLVIAAVLSLLLWQAGNVARRLDSQREDGRTRAFTIHVARLLAMLSLAGVVWGGAGLLALGLCSQYR